MMKVFFSLSLFFVYISLFLVLRHLHNHCTVNTTALHIYKQFCRFCCSAKEIIILRSFTYLHTHTHARTHSATHTHIHTRTQSHWHLGGYTCMCMHARNHRLCLPASLSRSLSLCLSVFVSGPILCRRMHQYNEVPVECRKSPYNFFSQLNIFIHTFFS